MRGPVPEDVLAVGVVLVLHDDRAGTGDQRLRCRHPLLEGGGRGDRLEDRAGRAHLHVRAMHERARGIVEQRTDIAAIRNAGEDVRVVGGERDQRQQLAAAHVHDDGGAGRHRRRLRVELLGGHAGEDPAGERLHHRRLESEVEREHEVRARLGRKLTQAPQLAPGRVGDDQPLPGRPPQLPLVPQLDPAAPHARVQRVALVEVVVDSRRGDRADVPQHVCEQLPAGVAAHRRSLHAHRRHARQRRTQRDRLLAVESAAHGHRCERVHRAQAVEHHALDLRVGHARLALQRKQHGAQRGELGGQVGRDDEHGEVGHVLHQRHAVAVVDQPTRGLQRQHAHLPRVAAGQLAASLDQLQAHELQSQQREDSERGVLEQAQAAGADRRLVDHTNARCSRGRAGVSASVSSAVASAVHSAATRYEPASEKIAPPSPAAAVSTAR